VEQHSRRRMHENRNLARFKVEVSHPLRHPPMKQTENEMTVRQAHTVYIRQTSLWITNPSLRLTKASGFRDRSNRMIRQPSKRFFDFSRCKTKTQLRHLLA